MNLPCPIVLDSSTLKLVDFLPKLCDQVGYRMNMPVVWYLSETELYSGYHILCYKQAPSWYDLKCVLKDVKPNNYPLKLICKVLTKVTPDDPKLHCINFKIILGSNTFGTMVMPPEVHCVQLLIVCTIQDEPWSWCLLSKYGSIIIEC